MDTPAAGNPADLVMADSVYRIGPVQELDPEWTKVCECGTILNEGNHLEMIHAHSTEEYPSVWSVGCPDCFRLYSNHIRLHEVDYGYIRGL